MSKIIGVTVGTPLSASSVANALKNAVSGSAVAMKDVSPLEHNIGVKLNYNKLSPNSSIETLLQISEAGSATLIFDGEETSGRYVVRSKGEDYILFDGGKLDDFSSLEVVNSINVGDVIQITIDEEDPTTWTVYLVETDFSSVTLKKCGKNLVDISQMLNKNLVDNGDGTFTYTRASSNYHSAEFPLKLKAGTTITLNMKQFSTTDDADKLTCYFTYADGTSKSSYIGSGTGMKFTAGKDIVKVQIFSYNAGTKFVFKNFQIEVGTTATEYEPFKEPIPYKPKADGTVDRVTSLYPSTTLLTDTEGVTVTAEYNKDLNKAFAELYQAIATMGAAAVTIPEDV